MTDRANGNTASGERSSSKLVWVLVGLGLVAFYVMRSREPAVDASLVGIPRPPMNVEGWLNTNGPLADEALRGKVVLVDAWASWCGPCRAKMPHLVEFEKRFRDQGLVVVGLTPETGSELPAVEKYVNSVPGLDWPIGYGADLPIDMMGVTAFPTLVLFDKSGKSTWAGHGFGGLEDAVIAALAEQTQLSTAEREDPKSRIAQSH